MITFFLTYLEEGEVVFEMGILYFDFPDRRQKTINPLDGGKLSLLVSSTML